MPENRAGRFRQAVDGVFASGEVGSINEYGEEQDLDLRFYPVFDDQGQVTRVAVFMADVTGARRMARL